MFYRTSFHWYVGRVCPAQNCYISSIYTNAYMNLFLISKLIIDCCIQDKKQIQFNIQLYFQSVIWFLWRQMEKVLVWKDFQCPVPVNVVNIYIYIPDTSSCTMFLAHINMCRHKFNLSLWKIRLQKMFGLFKRASNSFCVFNKSGIKMTLNWHLCMVHKTFSNTTNKTY